ncbi:CoA-transferase family III protein [delta proteobacterium NaphS2]|nr:CoA-transferase family III protein [delta proteobacterium NaphS2]
MDKSKNHKDVLPRPLEGIRVVEYGIFHAGPGATAILGDLGAEVIKIESKEGDPERHWTRLGPMDLALPDGECAMFQSSNRNKKGIGLDIKNPAGRKVFHRLIQNADVFLTNIRKSTKKKLQIDYHSLLSVNPKLIHANVSGYGPEGPMSDLGAFDPLGLARSGMMFVSGREEPLLMHIGILDQATSMAMSQAILTALFVRERRGVGQEIHVSLYGTAQWLMHPTLLIGNLLSVEPVIHHDRIAHSPLRNFFRCRDGEWIIGAHHPEDKYWKRFCDATEQSHLADDPRYATLETRAANNRELVEHFDEVFARKARDEWMKIFVTQGLMFCSIQHADEVKDDIQARVNGYVVELVDAKLGKVQVPGYPVHFSECTAGTRTLAPSLGEHTSEVLRETGYTESEIEKMLTAGAVF